LLELSNGIPVIGVLSQDDSAELEAIQAKYPFPIEAMSEKFDKYKPLLSPCLVAIDRYGRQLMVLPGLEGQDEYIDKILLKLVAKALFI